jgi:tripartite-type tricarboxylate transporter receptor subunit TctC
MGEMPMIAKVIAALMICIALPSWAQTYPDKPVTLVVPFAAGGPTDVVARQLAQAMGKSLGQSVIVENRPSAGGIVGTQHVVRSQPDGYTLLIHNIGMSTSPALYRKLPFNPLTDFEYVGQIVDVPMTLVGKKDLPANTFKELVAYLSANQKKVNMAHAGMGTASHLCGLLFMSRMEMAFTTVAYKGAAPALGDVQAGHVELMCDQTSTTSSVIKADRVKAYGATTLERLPILPNLPTLSEQGLTNFEVTVWHGLYAPKGTPKPIIDRLAKALQEGLASPAFRQSMELLGTTIATSEKATPEGLRKQLDAEINKWTPVIQQAKQYAD